MGTSWSWSYGSWIYNYLCNQCLSPLTLWVWIPLMASVLDTTLCDKVCQWLAAGQGFSPGNPVSSINRTDRHDITEILLKVVLNTITLTPNWSIMHCQKMVLFCNEELLEEEMRLFVLFLSVFCFGCDCKIVYLYIHSERGSS